MRILPSIIIEPTERHKENCKCNFCFWKRKWGYLASDAYRSDTEELLLKNIDMVFKNSGIVFDMKILERDFTI